MRLSLLLPAASLLCALPAAAQGRGSEDPTDLRAEIRRIVREEVRAAVKDALGRTDARSDSGKGADGGSRKPDTSDKPGQKRVPDRIVMRRIESEVDQIDDVMGKLEIALEDEKLEPHVLHLDNLKLERLDDLKVHFDEADSVVRSYVFDGHEIVPMRGGQFTFGVETDVQKAEAKKGRKANGAIEVVGSDEGGCVLRVECKDGQVKVLCNGEECVTTPAAGTGGACVLKIECDENGQCKVQTGSGSCCSEGAECCETSEGATATREPVKKTAGTKAAPVELKTRKARKTKTAGSIGSL